MLPTQAETTPLLPQLAAMQEHLERIRTRAEALRSLSPAQWLWSPAADVWSLALILDHLNTAEREVVPRIEQSIAALRREDRRSEGPFRYNSWERFFIRMLSPNPPFKLPVPPQFTPQAPEDPLSQVLDPFLALQERYLKILEQANGYDLKASRVTSPVSPLLKMTVGGYLEAMVAHERYHWTQVEAILANPQFSGLQ